MVQLRARFAATYGIPTTGGTFLDHQVVDIMAHDSSGWGVLRSKESGPKRLCKNTWASYISTGSVAGRDRLVVMAVTYARTKAGSPEIDIYGFTRRIFPIKITASAWGMRIRGIRHYKIDSSGVGGPRQETCEAA
jgi:hypothetical protein